MSHKGDHSGFSEMLLGREKRGGGGGVGREDDKGNRDGFAEISFIILRGDERGYEVFVENKATSDDGDDSALVSGSDSGSSKVLRTRVKGDETFDGAI